MPDGDTAEQLCVLSVLHTGTLYGNSVIRGGGISKHPVNMTFLLH